MILQSPITSRIVIAQPAPGGPAVPVDGPGVYVPASSSDWTALELPTPLAQWNCGDASGDAAPAIGSDALVAAGTGLLYQQSVGGWTRKFLGTTGASGQRWHSPAATFSIALNQAWAWLAYASFTASGSILLITMGSTNWGCALGGTGLLRSAFDGSFLNDTTGPVHTGIGTVHPFLVYRKSNSATAMGILTDIRNFAPAVSSAQDAITNVGSGFGPPSGNSLAARCGLLAFWKGADADTISTRAALVSLGWAPTW